MVSTKFFIKKNDERLKHYSIIRELYVNQLLAYYNNRPVKCSELGHLYYADDVLYNLDKRSLKFGNGSTKIELNLENIQTTCLIKG